MLKKRSDAENKKLQIKVFLPYILSFGITTLIMLLLYYKNDFCPFGEYSFASMDADIQYLDLFSYLKDVLSGDNNVAYTFSKSLGGTAIAVFAYYLSSPFNLLVVFFNKENLVLFFNIIVVLKLGTAALTATFFLRERFHGKLNNCFVVLLAVSYALMQYSIAQSSNIMWLDGVYMLPLMLAGVYRIVNGKRSNLLIFSTGLAILFNWYSAGINCVFTAIWFVLEWLLALPEKDIRFKAVLKDTAKKLGKYVLAMLFGVMLSAALFLPSMYSLISGGRAEVGESISQNSFVGNIINIFENLIIGSKSAKGNVSLYCGSLAILGCILFFISKNKSLARKIKIGTVLAFSLLIYYWKPLISLFSLFNDVYSYWYRYSYVTIFLIIFIAADYYSGLRAEKEYLKTFLKTAVLYSAVIMEVAYLSEEIITKNAYYTCICFFVIAVLTAVYFRVIKNNSKYRRLIALFVIGAVSLEMMYNANLVMKNYCKKNASKYEEYSASQQEQINKLQEADSAFYRISQTYTYNTSGTTGLTANYDEAFAYNYYSTTSYTSDPDEKQRAFMDKMGYPISGNNISVVDTSILAADSLLGVKYVLSSYQIKGLEAFDTSEGYNNKYIYYNPYALPMAFVYDSDAYTGEDEDLNPFEYQNLLYSELLGEEVELYKEAEFELTDDGNGTKTYTISFPEGNYVLYGNIVTSAYMDASLDVNDSYSISYSVKLAPSVFYIPTEDGEAVATVTFSYEEKEEEVEDTSEEENVDIISDEEEEKIVKEVTDEQFYVLDLDALEAAAGTLSSRGADTINIENGYAEIEVEANAGESLYISIPYDEGWTVTLNGQEITPELFADCLISIELADGANVIEMEYNVPYLKVGIIISLIALAIVIINIFVRRKHYAAVTDNTML